MAFSVIWETTLLGDPDGAETDLDQMMAHLLDEAHCVDPSIFYDRATGHLEVEVMIETTTRNDALVEGVRVISQALATAGIEGDVPSARISEPVPA